MQLTIYTDGGSRGNPGVAGGGVIVKADGKILHTARLPFGLKTNNEAEYLAVKAALEWLQEFVAEQPVSGTQFLLDSKLVVEQLNRRWKIKEPRLQPLAQECWAIIATFSFSPEFTHVAREQNAEADLLANEAMDALQAGFST